jgi:excinuclease ABC subunit A
MMDSIKIRGARTHNLQNVNLDLPRDRLIVITGLSGSGKSSLAFDTIYAEGQRRYVESLSSYARQFLSMMEKPDIDHIEGLSPAIAIEQKSTSHNPRSTVGTVTEIHDYLRLLFARVGIPRCPQHAIDLDAQTVSQMVDKILELPTGMRLMLLAPLVKDRKGEHVRLLEELRSQGFVRVRIDGEIVELDTPPALDLHRNHSIEVVIDRFRVREDIGLRLAESLETALKLGDGLTIVSRIGAAREPDQVFSAKFACPLCGYSIAELEPRLFSFNNPAGACSDCDGLGLREFFDPELVVIHPHLSLAGGAVRGWDRRYSHFFQMVNALSLHYGFDVETPFAELPDAIQAVVLFGSGGEPVKFQYLDSQGRPVAKTHAFEGVVPNMERRFRETQSPAVREELARFTATRSCPTCDGSRLNEQARHVFVEQRSIAEISGMSVGEAATLFRNLRLSGRRGEIAAKIRKEIEERLGFLVHVGLEYLTLDRNADSLSGGEAQRIRLASQIGAGLVGVMYVLDEPSIGLHQRDNQRLLDTLLRLRDLGNTVILVEHDEEAIRSADHVVDMGPGPGVHGGQVVAQGIPAEVEANPSSLTGQYLLGRRQIRVPKTRRSADPTRQLKICRASGNNLRDLSVDIPLGLMTCITGVSGSGKSTLINDTLYRYSARDLNGASVHPEKCEAIIGLNFLDKVVNIDQSPIGRTPRSNPATYTGLFTPIRELFAATPEARSRGYTPGRFSFNVKGGRCEACQGDGVIKVEMHFLPDVYVACDVCGGKRYNRETLDIRYKGKSIHEVLETTVEDGLELFSSIPPLNRKLSTLMDVGLSYIRLGQSATTLSGGEAQRVKLARELSKRDTGNTLYILDEPTTGLHFHDIEQLLAVLHRLRDHGNTVVVIEHNLDVIKTADWVIDLGPEGGKGGGQQVVAGTPESVADTPTSHTGRFLAQALGRIDKSREAS